MSNFLTCFLNKAIDFDSLMSLGSLDQMTGPINLTLCLPYVVVFTLGILKSSEFRRLYPVLLELLCILG